MTASPSLLLPLLLLPFLSLVARPVHGEGQDNTLQLVHMLYRHGERSPITLYPNDPHSNVSAVWPMGLGQLTKKGKAMHYTLGRWLRERYKALVRPDWVPEEVVVHSTDVDRTLMSAACNLAAFYFPQREDERFEEHLPWVPIPIHTTPLTMDKLLHVEDTCPRLPKEAQKMYDLPEVKKVIEENQHLFEFLTDKTGGPVNNISSVGYLFDTLSIEAVHNLTLPSWTQEVWSQMKQISDFSFALTAYTPELKRLRAGPLIKAFRENMEQKVAGQTNATKMFIYSAHDTTVATILEALGVYNGIPPPYAATFLLELHRVGDQHFVKMFYRNDTAIKEPPHPLVLEGCYERCLLQDWLALTASLVPQDWDKECQSLPFGLPFSTLAAVCAVVLLGLLLLLLVTYNLVTWRRQKSHFAYQAVPSSSP